MCLMVHDCVRKKPTNQLCLEQYSKTRDSEIIIVVLKCNFIYSLSSNTIVRILCYFNEMQKTTVHIGTHKYMRVHWEIYMCVFLPGISCGQNSLQAGQWGSLRPLK